MDLLLQELKEAIISLNMLMEDGQLCLFTGEKPSARDC